MSFSDGSLGRDRTDSRLARRGASKRLSLQRYSAQENKADTLKAFCGGRMIVFGKDLITQ